MVLLSTCGKITSAINPSFLPSTAIAEIRLLEAWKAIHFEDYCLKDTLEIKEKSKHMETRSNKQTLLITGERDKFTNGSFIHLTAQIWNSAPLSVKDSTKLSQAKRAIRCFVRTLPV